MAEPFHIKFTSGDFKGASFKIKDGLTLGRAKADLNFKDPKISTVHVKFIREETGKWFIKDMDSTNGIWFDGKKVKAQELQAGQQFRIGSIEFEIISPFQSVQPDPTEIKAWREPLFNFLDRLQLKQTPQALSAFHPPLILTITEGQQASTKWVLGYGPRDIGPVHFDHPILEPGSPDTCFTIEPSAAGPIIKTAFPDKVLLNGQSKDTEKIHDGLWIKIQNTKIVVSLDHETDS